MFKFKFAVAAALAWAISRVTPGPLSLRHRTSNCQPELRSAIQITTLTVTGSDGRTGRPRSHCDRDGASSRKALAPDRARQELDNQIKSKDGRVEFSLRVSVSLSLSLLPSLPPSLSVSVSLSLSLARSLSLSLSLSLSFCVEALSTLTQVISRSIVR